MNILLIGNGKMKEAICNYIKDKNIFIADVLYKKHLTYKKKYDIDAIIDFSSPEALPLSIKYQNRFKCPLIIGTTNYNMDELKIIKENSKLFPIGMDSNFSKVFHLFNKLNKLVSNYDIDKKKYIIETHHNGKSLKPSGSSLLLNDENTQIFSLRGGNNVGKHEVIYLFENEEIYLTHQAFSKEIFVEGAFELLNYIKGKKCGLFSYSDYIKVKYDI